MPFFLTMPKLSPTMESGTITKWRKAVGDQVKEGDVLIEVATDKANVEYQALDGGFLRKILIQEGGSAAINQPIAVFTETASESIDNFAPPPVESPPLQKQEAPKKEDDAKAPNQPAAPFNPSPSMPSATFAPEPALKEQFYQTSDSQERPFATPLARKQAKDAGVDLSAVKGTGPRGRVTSRDLAGAPQHALVAFNRRPSCAFAAGSYTEENMSPMRAAIGTRLQQAKTFIPHFYLTIQIDASALACTYQQCKEGQLGLSYNDFVTRACALALGRYHAVNSGFNSEKQTLVRFQTVDIAIAVSLQAGLITPIVRHADCKNIGELSLEIKELVKKARQMKLPAQSYKGGSFTISNLGMYGIKEFQAILNPPQAAILAVGALLDSPVVKEGKVVPGKIMNITLSCDHRVIDGAQAAEFLRFLKELLENPSLLLI